MAEPKADRLNPAEFFQGMDNEMAILSECSLKTQTEVSEEIRRRQGVLTSLIIQTGGDVDKMFELIFGKKLSKGSNVKAVIKPYGVYFEGIDPVFGKVDKELEIGIMGAMGAALTRRTEGIEYDTKYKGMVGLGFKQSTDHEMSHLFHSMFPYNKLLAEYESLSDPERNASMDDTDDEIEKLTDRINFLVLSVDIRDELAARIRNRQIFEVREEEEGNPYSSSEFVYTTYSKPRHKSAYERYNISFFDLKQMAPDEKNKIQVFWKRHYKIESGVVEKYREKYNKILSWIKSSLNEGETPISIEAKLLDTDMSEL